MKRSRMNGMGFLAGFLLVGACGEEIAEQRQVAAEEPLGKPACELILQVDLQQIFVNPLKADAGAASDEQCTWVDAASDEPFVQYELRQYSENLQTHVDALEEELGRGINPRFVQGIGDSAVWTDAGLFANRAGRTLQVKPLTDDENRAAYQELARLLLTRMEGN